MSEAASGSCKSSKNELRFLLNLLELKNEKPDDIVRDQKFLTAAFGFLEGHSECIWCQYPDICGELLRLFSFKESPPLQWFREKTLKCLTSCRACIESYYGVRPSVFSGFRKIYDSATVREFEGKIHEFDVWRLKGPFASYLNDDREVRKKIPIKFLLFEILLFPGWIVSEELSGPFEGVLGEIISSRKMVKISEKLPGVVVCSVHPNAIIRNWAKTVLNSDMQATTTTDNNNCTNTHYDQINFSWDTVVMLSRGLEDSQYIDAMYTCLKSSQANFIASCANWDWTDRIFDLLKQHGNPRFLECLRLYGTLLKVVGGCKRQWNRLADSISDILDNPGFVEGAHTGQNSECANFVLDWIPWAVKTQLDHPNASFKSAHKLVSELMQFVLESRATFSFKVKVVACFAEPLSESLVDTYLLGKMCQLVLFLFDRRFAEFRTTEIENEIQRTSENLFIALIHNDLRNEKHTLQGTPPSAVFDASSNYRKYISTIESRQVSLEFLNSLAKEFRQNLLNRKVHQDLIGFLFRESLSHSREINTFSSTLVFVLIFYQISLFKPYSSLEAQDAFFTRLIQHHPEKALQTLTEAIPLLLQCKFKILTDNSKDAVIIPIEKSLYFFNSIIGKVFERDPSILSIYPEKNILIFAFFAEVILPFLADINSFFSLPGGTVYFELAVSLSSFFWLLCDGEHFFKITCHQTMIKSTSAKSTEIVNCLSGALMALLQMSSKSPMSSQSLVNLSSQLIGLCAFLKIDLETGNNRADQILNVLLTSTAISIEHKSIISRALQSYNSKMGKTIKIPNSTPVPITTSTASAGLDPSISKKLEALERMDNEYINKQLSSTTNTAATSHHQNIPQKANSKLGQLKQDLVREVGHTSKKSRFAPIIVQQKAPRMMTQADLIRARDVSSDSEVEDEITSDTFKNTANRPTTTSAMSNTAHRSIKLIDEGEKRQTNLVGQPITSKAVTSFAAQMQRDWQSAQRLHRYILGLCYESLDESNILDNSLQGIPDSFSTYDKYLQVFEPLLQLECRAQIIQAKDELGGRLTYYKGIVQSVSMVDDFHEIVFNFGDDSVHRIFTEQDVIVGHPFHSQHKPINSRSYNHNSNTDTNTNILVESLGLVILTVSRTSGFEVTARFCKRDSDSFQLLTRLKQPWKFGKLCNTVTNNREFLALHNLPLFPSCNRILQPKFSDPAAKLQSHIDKAATFYMRAFGLNSPQASAIAFSLLNPNFFTLIQGPPGTGKTRTIEGFMAVLFGRPTDEQEIRLSHATKRILVCAPSNAAIDEIVRRLKCGVRDSYGHLIPLRIVRVGSTEMIHEDVKDLSIDALVETKIQGHIASALEMLQNNRKQLAEIKSLLDKTENKDSDDEDQEEDIKIDEDVIEITDSTNYSGSNKQSNVRTLKNQLWQLKENIRKGSKFIEDSRQTLRVRVLNEAQVVCCTLSASGHEVISRIDGEFEMVIIDEACQATELSALIPLQYGCKRAILVGDPNQLPPTVISQTAVTFAYEQSLFQRLQKVAPAQVQLLSLQYRMHPDISAFPSAHFYSSKLLNGPNVAFENTRPWHGQFNNLLGPCRFFDIPTGKEQVRTFSSGKLGKSMMNDLEAKITCSLIALLTNSSPDYNVRHDFYPLIIVINL
jgi:DNA polymerase III delta prime subunit